MCRSVSLTISSVPLDSSHLTNGCSPERLPLTSSKPLDGTTRQRQRSQRSLLDMQCWDIIVALSIPPQETSCEMLKRWCRLKVWLKCLNFETSLKSWGSRITCCTRVQLSVFGSGAQNPLFNQFFLKMIWCLR